jgi:hypothetical protein
MKRYEEMGYRQGLFEEKIITPRLMIFMKHLFKVKLCDATLTNKFFKGLDNFTKKHLLTWENQSIKLFHEVLDKINEKVITTGTKEKAYKSVIDNLDIEMNNPEGFDEALKKAISNHPKNEKIKKSFENFREDHDLTEEAWFKNIVDFLNSINIKEPINKNDQKFKEFIQNFIKNFK